MEAERNNMAFNAGYSLDGSHKAHSLCNIMRIDHQTSQKHSARFYLCFDQCPCIAADVPLKGGADPSGDQPVHQLRFGFLCLGKGRRLNQANDAIDGTRAVLSTIV